MEQVNSPPPASPAAMLAAVLRILHPGKAIQFAMRRVRIGSLTSFGMFYEASFDPTSKDDLARVVAMLTPEQRERFDDAYGVTAGLGLPSEIITAPASIWLAALVAATGSGE